MSAAVKTFSKGGVHPPQCKFTAGLPVVAMDLPRRVVLTLNQHIGAPAVPVVKCGDHVRRFDMVAESQSFMSVPVHTPVSGTVKSVGCITDAFGKVARAVVVEATDDDHAADCALPESRAIAHEAIDALTPADIRAAVQRAGIVGLGGAAFPTHVKLTPPTDVIVDTLCLNGAECEPFLTCDDALMRRSAKEIVRGALLAMKACGASRVIVGIENNKPEAIEAMTAACGRRGNCSVVPLAARYPQGGEKQLIKALTGRTVLTGALPASVGVVVMNVATAYAVCRAVVYGEPLVERVLTLTGSDVDGGGNFRVALGTPVEEIVALCSTESPVGKILSGGPMMGRAMENLSAPVTKGTSGIVLLSGAVSRRPAVQPCVRCGRCVDVCPMGLEPLLISTLSRLGRFDEAVDESVLSCIECGSCQYACPSARPLLDYIRSGKQAARMKVKRK